MNRRNLLIAASLALGSCATIIFAARWMMTYTPACAQPCKDLDSADCRPFELSLSLADASVKTKTPYALWYKVGLLNRSCQNLETAGAAFASGDLNSPEIEIRITDSKGALIPLTPPLSIKGNAFTPPGSKPTVVPYMADNEESDKITARFKMDQFLRFVLRPGERIETAGVRWLPHTIEIGDVGGGSGFIRKPVANLPMPRQFPGYRAAGQFDKPGVYFVQAFFRDENARIGENRPQENRVPKLIRGIFNALLPMGIDLFPATREPRKIALNLESPRIEIKAVE
jgi:hypothetical protein